MTAYSRSVLTTSLGRFVVELQSVNRKHLEINTFLPKTLYCFDSDIKKWVAHVVRRGQVNIRVSAAFEQQSAAIVKPNLCLAAQLKASWDEIASHLQLTPSPFPLQLLAEEEGILFYEDVLQDEELVRESLSSLFAQALNQLVAMKLKEGEALHNDIATRLSRLKVFIDKIVHKAPDAIKKFREKLAAKLHEALAAWAPTENDDRLIREVCLFADKVDIAEEITRFNSHLDQFGQVLDSDEEGVGKTLEFILQELNREANTIGSKSADVEISRLIIEIKSELERIREQIQNVE